jgi:hypothetical protein
MIKVNRVQEELSDWSRGLRRIFRIKPGLQPDISYEHLLG